MDIVVRVLSRQLLKKNISRFIQILMDIPDEYWEESHFLKDLDNKYEVSCLAYEKDKIIGYIIASSKDHDTVHIHKYMVDKNYRGKKVGKNLYEFFINIVRNKHFSQVSLNVSSKNYSAIKFYESIGFEKINIHKDTVTDKKLLLYKKHIDYDSSNSST